MPLGFTERGDDGVITVYAKHPGLSEDQLVAEGQKVVAYIKDQHFADIESISVIDPFITGVNPGSQPRFSSHPTCQRDGR